MKRRVGQQNELDIYILNVLWSRRLNDSAIISGLLVGSYKVKAIYFSSRAEIC